MMDYFEDCKEQCGIRQPPCIDYHDDTMDNGSKNDDNNEVKQCMVTIMK
jgi:hypothetical protein